MNSTTTAAAVPSKERKSTIRRIMEDTKEFMRLCELKGGLVPQSMVGTILGVSRQRVHQLVAEGTFSHWTFHGIRWLSQDEVVAFAKLNRRAGENQHKPSAKEMWKVSQEVGKEYMKNRRTARGS